MKLTATERKVIKAVRKLIAKYPELFRKARGWFNTVYAIDEIDRRNQRDHPHDIHYDREHRNKTREKSSIPHARLMACIKEFLLDPPQLYIMEYSDQEKVAARIVYVTWLAVDPDASGVAPGFGEIELAPWEGNKILGRWWVFMDARRLDWFEFAAEAVEVMEDMAKPLNTDVIVETKLDEIPKGQDDDFKSGQWFTLNTNVPTARLRQAAGSNRKSKRVRKRVFDGVVLYSVANVRQWWPGDMMGV